ncbi:MAG: cytochrome c-type biogenesis protein CcmH [Gemmatimonadota bacterium]
MNRRGFLARGAGAGFALLLPQRPGRDSSDALKQPELVGQLQPIVSAQDNDPGIVAVERRLHCTCGCGLDIYTCRTTDFSCTYSPALHREVLDLVKKGGDARAVVAAFVSKYGESVLMAPAPRGFNLLGYLVPGAAVLAAGSILALVLVKRRRPVAAAPVPAAGAAPTPEDERLERALRELDA